MEQELIDYIDNLTPNVDYPYFCTMSAQSGNKWNPDHLESPKECIISKCLKLLRRLDEKKISSTTKELVDVFESEATREYKAQNRNNRRRLMGKYA